MLRLVSFGRLIQIFQQESPTPRYKTSNKKWHSDGVMEWNRSTHSDNLKNNIFQVKKEGSVDAGNMKNLMEVAMEHLKTQILKKVRK